jgi:hypothetical protein
MSSEVTTARLRRTTELLSEVTGITWTVGYIGNCDNRRDDRSWFLFADHPGRVGTASDRIGGVDTANLNDLALMASGALRMAKFMAAKS